MTFQEKFPKAVSDPNELDTALDEMIEIAATGGEESFQFVCGAVWAIRSMRTSGTSPYATAARLWADQELGIL